MTPELLAHIHARTMQVPSSWSAKEIEQVLSGSGAFLVTHPDSFAIGRVTLDEAELLTLAVDPDRHHRGLGTQCLGAFERQAQNRGATRAFLEVAATNTAARALYTKASWSEEGLRKAYYRAKPARIDAIIMRKTL